MDEKMLAGKYRVAREMSSAASGRTWLATGPDGDQVVVKVVHPQDDAASELLEHDVELASGIHDPALPRIVEWGHEGHDFFVVREYVTGADLKTELALQGRFAPYTVARYGAAAAGALAQLHGRGIAHGNVMTANLLRSASDDVKLVDSGLGERNVARLLTAAGPASAASYLAPERVEGGPPSVAADIYALGAVLYELAAGRPPFEGDTAAEVADQQLHATPPSLQEFAPDTPAGLEVAIMKALEKSPSARWSSAEEMRAVLDAVSKAEAPDTEPLVAEEAARGMGAGAWIAIAVLVLLLLLGGAWALGLFGGGGIVVPDVTGKTVVDARATMSAAGLQVGSVTYSGAAVPGIADGLVAQQRPAAGAKAASGSAVGLVLAGRQMFTVPDLVGRRQEDAMVLIEDAGLVVGNVTNVATTTVDPDIVTSQEPEEGTQAAAGTSVDIWVARSATTALVPNVVGAVQADAVNTLTAAGFLSVVTLKTGGGTVGTVVVQSPVAGTTAVAGSTVVITVVQ